MPRVKLGSFEALIACGFRHVLEHAQFLLQDLLTVPRHLAPFRKHVILDVIALSRASSGSRLPLSNASLALLRGHVVPLIELLADFVLLIRRKILEGAAVLQDALALCRRQIAHGVDPRACRTHAKLLPRDSDSRRHLADTRCCNLPVEPHAIAGRGYSGLPAG